MSALNVQHANTAVPQHQRHRKFRTDTLDSIDITGISERVSHANRMARRGRGARYSLPHRNAHVFHQLARIAARTAMPRGGSITLEHSHDHNLLIHIPR